MLHISYGPMEGVVLKPSVYFKNAYETLILIAHVPDKVFNASNCGDNCAKWLLAMGKEQDITINLRHLMDFGEGSFDIKILNTGDIVHSMRELVPIAGDFV